MFIQREKDKSSTVTTTTPNVKSPTAALPLDKKAGVKRRAIGLFTDLSKKAL